MAFESLCIEQTLHNLFYWHFKLYLFTSLISGIHYTIRFRNIFIVRRGFIEMQLRVVVFIIVCIKSQL